MKKYDLKSILIGVIIGIIVTTSVLYLIGDIDIQTEIQLGENERWVMTKPTIELLSASLELIEPVNFPLYEFSGRSEGEVTQWRNSYLLYYILLGMIKWLPSKFGIPKPYNFMM